MHLHALKNFDVVELTENESNEIVGGNLFTSLEKAAAWAVKTVAVAARGFAHGVADGYHDMMEATK